MKNLISILFLIAFSNLTLAQKGKAILILKDSTQIHGIGEISGISSIASIKFKNDTLKYRTYKSKEIIGIDILENDYYRKFRFKYIDDHKYPEIMEIVSIDGLSLYLRVYEGSALLNSFYIEKVKATEFNLEHTATPEMENKSVQSQNIYYEINFPRYSYYVGIGENDQVKSLYSKGLPFSKSFKNAMKDYFKDCPELIEKTESEEFKKDELWKVLDFYNRKCLKESAE